jgi:2,3-bisphosphoglycerate-dependent phosphoglycerate mutase
MVRLVYETHSTTVDNEIGVATGWLPGDLSEQGVRNAEALGRRRRHDGVDAVFCSDLRRAVQTASIAFDGTGIPVLLDWRLRETDYGDLNGQPTSIFHRDRLTYLDAPYPNGESWREAADRTREALRDITRRWDGRRIVLIGHAAQRYALRELFEGIPLQDALAAPFEWREGWEYELTPEMV